MQEVRLEHRGEQVVRGADRVDVAGEVEVQVLHRHDLRVAAARGAALDPEDRPERGLAQAEHRLAADVAEALRERDRGRRLALAGLRRRDRGDADELPVRPCRASRSSTERSIFAFVRPYGSTSSGSRPAAAAISSIGRSVAACAISRLDGSAVVIRRTLMPRDGAEVALVRARLDDLADLRDHVPELVVGGVVVRPDPDAGAGTEVAEDLPLARAPCARPGTRRRGR